MKLYLIAKNVDDALLTTSLGLAGPEKQDAVANLELIDKSVKDEWAVYEVTLNATKIEETLL